jgi:hypothetical protein
MGEIFKRLIIVILFPLIVWAVFALLWGSVLGLNEAAGLSVLDTLHGRRGVLLGLFFVSLFIGWRISRAMW